MSRMEKKVIQCFEIIRVIRAIRGFTSLFFDDAFPCQFRFFEIQQ